MQSISQALEQTSDEASAIPVTSAATNVGLEMFTPHDREKLVLLLSAIPTRPLSNGIARSSSSSDNLAKNKRDNSDICNDILNKKVGGLLGKGKEAIRC